MEIAEVIELINQVNDDYKINSNKINGLKGLAYKNSLDYSEISNIPTDIVRDPSYVHTDNNFDSQYKNKLDSLSNYSLPMASATVLGGVKKGSGVDITDGVLTVTDQTLAMTSSTANNASVTQHGFAPQAIAPSAGFINYLGLVAGETVFSNKPLFSSNVPSTQNYGDSASAGTAMTAARLDHKHAIPASTKDKTAVTGILKGDGANVSQAVAGTDYVVDTNYVHTDNNLTGSLLTKLNSLNNYSLPIASVSSLGGIKVGSGLSIDAGGVLSTSGLQGTLSGASGGVAILNSNVIRSLVSGSNINITVAGDNITITNTYSYTHPATHPASIIVQDSSNRFVTDTQISNWNAKQNALGYTAENVSNKGIANGYVPLNASAIIDSIYLPSYVDDVLEYNSLSAFPTTGETGKIYVAKDANITYRWGGSGYVEISASLALGTTSSTAYRGDYGNVAYLHSQSTGNPHGATTAQIAESGNLYYTQARFDSAFSGKSTTNLTEGNNLYFTNARAVAALATGNIVNNLNADMVDGKHTSNLYGDWNANLSTVDWNAKDIRAYGMLKGNNIYSLGSLYLETAPIYFLNKAGNDWLLFATRDTSGSEVRVNLDYVGSFHAYGNAQIDSYIRSIRRGISYIGNWDGANYWGIGNYNANTIQFREVDADGNILSGLANLYLNGNLTVNGTETNTFAGTISTPKLIGITDTNVVTNLNADMVDGLHKQDIINRYNIADAGSAGWRKLVTWDVEYNGGQKCIIRLYFSSGYNANEGQQKYQELRLALSNGSSTFNGCYFSAKCYRNDGTSASNFFRVVQLSATKFEVWHYTDGAYTGASFYEIGYSNGTITPSYGSFTTDTPTGTFMDYSGEHYFHSGNANLSTVDWDTKDIRAYGKIQGDKGINIGATMTNDLFRKYVFNAYTDSATEYAYVGFHPNSGEMQHLAGFSGWGGYHTFYGNGNLILKLDTDKSIRAYGNAQIDGYASFVGEIRAGNKLNMQYGGSYIAMLSRFGNETNGQMLFNNGTVQNFVLAETGASIYTIGRGNEAGVITGRVIDFNTADYSIRAYGNAQIDGNLIIGLNKLYNEPILSFKNNANYFRSDGSYLVLHNTTNDKMYLTGYSELIVDGNLTVNGTGTNYFAGLISANAGVTVNGGIRLSKDFTIDGTGLEIRDASGTTYIQNYNRGNGNTYGDIVFTGTKFDFNLGVITANAGVIVADSSAIKSATFSSNDPYSGYSLSFNSQVFSHLYVGEMRVKKFIADQEQALAGSQVIAKSTVKLSEDMRKDGLVSGDRFDITVDSYEGSPNLAVFADGYLVRIRQYSRVGLAFNVTDTWAIVQGSDPVNSPIYTNGGKQQTWSLMYVSGATYFELGKGSIILAYGNPGDGIIENMANGDPIAKLPYGRIRRYTSLADGIPQFDTLTQWGDLSNITTNVYGQLKGQGFYSQNLYLEGNANIAGTLTAGDANGVGNTFYAGKIKKNLLTNSNTVSTVNIALNGAIPDIFGQNFNFTSGKTYTISFKAKGSGNCDFWLYNNSWNKSQQQNITLTADYVRYTLTYTATTTELYRYGVWTNGTGNTAINLTITEWQLEEGSYATPYQPTDGVLSTDNGYGMWAINGGFGGTIQNPVVALSDYGLILRNVSTTAKVTAQDGVHIGNFSASNDYSGIIQNNTGLYGYQNGNLLMKIANDSAKFVGFDAVSDEIGNRLTTSNGQDGYLALSGTSSYNTGLTVWDSSVYLSIGLGLYKGSQSGNWDSASKGIAFADLTSGKTLFELSNTQRIISGFSFDYQKLYNGNMRLEASSTFKGLAVKNTINKTEYDILKVGQYTPSIISPTTQIVTDANASSLFYQNVTFRDLNASNYINSFYSGDKTLTMNIRAYNSNKTSIQGSEYGSTTGIYSNGQTIGTVWFKLNLSAYANKYIKRIKIGVRRVDGSSCSVNIGNGSIQQIYGTYTYQKNFSGSAEIDNLNLSTNVDTYLCFQITNTSTEELNDYTLNWCFQLFELEIYDSTQFADISDNKIQFYKSGGNEGIFFDENGFRIKSKDLFIGKWKITEIPDNRLVFSVLQTDGSYLEKYRLDPSIAAKTL